MRQLLIIITIFYLLPARAQQIISISPNSGTPGQTLSVFIRGVNTHFQNGVSHADFGAGITVQSLAVTNAITATATIIITGSASAGNRNVEITTGREVANGSNMFEVFSLGSMFNVNLTVLPIGSVSLKNIDLTNPAATPVLFYTDVYNDNTARMINLKLSLYNSGGLLGSMTLKNQSLTARSHTTWSNRQFTSVNLNGTAGQNFLNTVEASGTFPPDNYTYKIVVTDINGTPLDSASVTPTPISNPILNPELISPGMSFNYNIDNVYIANPFFQWFGQNDKYDFALYFYQNGQSAEDVVRTLPVYQQKGITGTTLNYPVSAEKLIDGRTYAWQVVGEAATANGINYMPSDVFRFTYTEPGSNQSIVSTIQITPPEISLYTGQQYQFSALCYDLNGALVSNANPIWQVTPAQGTITQAGLFTAGNQVATMAVVVTAGTASQYATININAADTTTNTQDWLIDGLVRQLFGLPQ